MSAGLKQEMGLGEPQSQDSPSPGSTEQKDQFKAAFQAEKRQIDQALQYTAANAERRLHDPLAAKRDKCCSAYQAALTKIDPANPAVAKGAIDRVISAVQGVVTAVNSVKQAVAKAYDAWVGRESDVDGAADKIREMVDWGQQKAGKLQLVVDVVVGKANQRKWQEALQALEQLLQKLGPIFEEYQRQLAAQQQYEEGLATLQPMLAAASTCEFARLEGMQQPIESLQEQMRQAAESLDYVAALELLKNLEPLVTELLNEVERLRVQREAYRQRRAALDPKLTEASTSRFPALADLDQQIADLTTQMEQAATDEDFELALQIVDHLSTLVDEKIARAAALEVARQEYEQARAALDPRLTEASICKFQVLAEMDQQIADLTTQMNDAAAAEDYERALQILGELSLIVEEKLAKEQELEEKKAEYESRLADILQRFDAIAQCEYPQLTDDHSQMIELRDKMEAEATAGEYIRAVETMNQLEQLITQLENALAELDARRQEYEERLPDLIERLDSNKVSDFKELEEPRIVLENGRAEMEAAAEAKDFPTAVDHMNALEQQLDVLEDRLAELIQLKEQYEAAYESLTEDLASVERTDHPELADKKSEILQLRDQMTTAAEATDYGTALEQAEALKPLVVAFLGQKEKREEYMRRLALVEPRVEAAKKIEYKTLEDDKTAIETLFGEMAAEAAKGEFVAALTQMESLESKLDEIEKAHQTIKEQEIRYQERHDMLKPQVDVAQENTSETAGDAAEAVGDKYEEMTGLAEEHKFAEAIEASKALQEAIQAYEDKLGQIEDAKEKFEALSKSALARLKKAEGDAKEFENTLEDDYEDLDSIKEDMESKAKDESYEDALAKLEELNSGLDAFEARLLKVKEAKAAYKARSQKAIADFNGLPEEAEEKAADDYAKAKDHLDDMESKADDEEYEEAMEELGKLEAALEEIKDALKTDAELEAEYNGRSESLQPRVEKAKSSPWIEQLASEGGAVESAFAEMETSANRKDFRGALEHADKVESALSEFDQAEDKWEQKKVQFDERMQGIKPRFDKAKAVSWPPELLSRTQKLPGMWDAAMADAKDKDLDSALAKADALSTEVEAILAEQEQLEEDDSDDDSIVDDIIDFGGDVLEKGKDLVVDEIKDVITGTPKAVMETYENAKEVIEHVKDGEIWEAAKDAVDTVDSATDVVPLTRKGKRLVKKVKNIKEVTEIIEDVKDTAENIKDTVEEIVGGDD